MNSQDALIALKSYASPKRAKANTWFFKTGPGEYGEGDEFWGLTVPEVRQVVKKFKDLELSEVLILLHHKVHEVRLCAVLLLVSKYPKNQKLVYDAYLANTQYINNWDLVDSSAPQIVGMYLKDRPKDILTRLAKSKSLWERRIAVLATFQFIKNKSASESLKIATLLLNDHEDLIQKAVGWMLREIGKRCSRETEVEFLEKHASTMPRTMLRYAIEHFTPDERQKFLHAT